MFVCQVHGHVEDKCLFIDVPIGQSSIHTDIYRMCVSSSPHCIQPVKRCSTVAVRLETGLYDGAAASKLLLIPLTGKVWYLYSNSDEKADKTNIYLSNKTDMSKA